MQGQDILIQLLAKLDTSSVNADYEKLKKQLTSDPFIQKLTFDTSMSKQAIKAMASEIHNELGKAFKLSGVKEFDITVKDVESILSNAVKQSNKLASEIDKSSNSAQKFLARFNNKTGGTLINSKEFKEVQDAINGLGKTHSIDQLNASMDKLETTYNNMVANLRTGSKSLNPFVNAITDMNNMDKTIKDIELQFKSLSSQPKAVADSIKQLSAQQSEVNKYAQGTLEWSQAYGKLKSSITSVKAELSNLLKSKNVGETTTIFNTADLDKQGKIYVQKVSNTVEKMKLELTSKMKSAGYFDIDIKGVEDATGKIKSLTATATDANGVLKQLSFTREKLQGKGKAQAGFVQTDDVKVLGTVSDLAQKSISSLDTLKQKWADNGILVGEFKNKVDQLESAFANVSSKGGLETLKGELQSLKLEADKITQSNKIQLSLDDGTYEAKVENLIAKTRQWTDENNNARISTTNLSTAWNKLATAQNDQDKIKYAQELDAEIKKVTNDVKIMNSNLAKDSAVSSFHQQLQEFKDKNGKAMTGVWKIQINDMLKATASGAEVANSKLTEMKQTYYGVCNAARKAGKLGKSFTQSIVEQAKSFTQWVSISGVIMEGVQAARKMVTAVYDIDTAMTELAKVSDATMSQLEGSLNQSIETAKKYGATVDDVVNATADWSRLGYNLEDSEKLAEIATIYKNVGDGIDIDAANQSLVSTLQGFKMEADDAMHIIDAFNQVGNNFAIGSDGIGEALKRSASSMYAAGNSLEESIGLITAANEVVQDPESVGTAYKTIAMRIRGAKTELEEMGADTDGMVESTAKLRDEIKALSGVDIMQDENTFKSTYDILDELAGKWQNLTDIQQASITELIAGKRQGNIVLALMNNFDTARDAMESAVGSEGSALKEQETQLDSLGAKTRQFQAQFQELATVIVNSDFLKGLVDTGTDLLGIITAITDKIGVLSVAGLGIGAAFSKNLGGLKMLRPLNMPIV